MPIHTIDPRWDLARRTVIDCAATCRLNILHSLKRTFGGKVDEMAASKWNSKTNKNSYADSAISVLCPITLVFSPNKSLPRFVRESYVGLLRAGYNVNVTQDFEVLLSTSTSGSSPRIEHEGRRGIYIIYDPTKSGNFALQIHSRLNENKHNINPKIGIVYIINRRSGKMMDFSFSHPNTLALWSYPITSNKTLETINDIITSFVDKLSSEKHSEYQEEPPVSAKLAVVQLRSVVTELRSFQLNSISAQINQLEIIADTLNDDVSNINDPMLIKRVMHIIHGIFGVVDNSGTAKILIKGAIATFVGLGGIWPTTCLGLLLATSHGKDALLKAIERIGVNRQDGD